MSGMWKTVRSPTKNILPINEYTNKKGGKPLSFLFTTYFLIIH